MNLGLSRSFAFFALVIVLLVTPPAQGGEQTLYSISSDDNLLRTINPTDGSTISEVTITLQGQTVLWGNGLARHPLTGKLFALLTLDNGSGQPRSARELVTINPSTGAATSIGNTGRNFAGLAFVSDGTLYGVTGDGSGGGQGSPPANPESLFTLNTTTGAATSPRFLGNGDAGETIAFNPDDGRIYHASGLDTPIFESFVPPSGAITNIPLSGAGLADLFEATAFTFFQDGAFLMGDLAGNFMRITTGGDVTVLGFMDHVAKGLAFVPKQPSDFDGDVRTDTAVYQRSTGDWSIVGSTNGFSQQLAFGGTGFVPVTGDYDGDGRTDTAVYQTSTGHWFFVGSTSGFGAHLNFGGAGFVPVPGDYDGDGATDRALYQTSTGNWFIAQSTGGIRVHPAFGGPGFVPVPGDYDGDGETDTAVYQTSTGHWFFVGSTTGFGAHLNFGGPGFVPVPGDYDGDGETDAAVYQTSTGHWFFVGSTTGFGAQLNFGGPGFVPVPGDYDGDGETDRAVYQTSTGNWFIAQSTAGFLIRPGFGGSAFDPVLPIVTILKAVGLL
jgi:hypothetical protein